MEITDGEVLDLLEEEGDWILVQRAGNKPSVGFVPANYVEVSPRQLLTSFNYYSFSYISFV